MTNFVYQFNGFCGEIFQKTITAKTGNKAYAKLAKFIERYSEDMDIESVQLIRFSENAE